MPSALRTPSQSRLRTLAGANASPRAVHAPPTAESNPAAQFERRLFESFATILPAWALKAVADPFAYGLTGAGGYSFATGTVNDRRGGKDIPLYWNEIDLRGYRILARQICDSNQFGIGFTKLLTAYHIRKGYGWQACLKGHQKTPYATAGAPVDPLVSKAQGLLDQWRDGNLWPLKSREAFRRWCRDGETFGRFFQQGHAKLATFRFIEPEQVGSPTGNVDDDESFGVATEPGDPCCPVAYHLWRMESPLIGDWIDAERIIHARKNVDSGIKRGLPDFFPVAEDLDGVRRLLHTMLATSIKQARTAWIEKLQNASAQQAVSAVPEYANSATNRLQPYTADDIGRAIADQFGRFGLMGQSLSDVRRVEGSRQFEPGPAASPSGYIEVEQAVLRGCGIIWNFPEYFSGDASNNNMASSIVAGSPFTVTVEGSQFEWGAIWEKPVALKVLELARDAGLLSWVEWSRLDVEVTEPAVSTADPLKDTQVYTQQLQAKIVCLDTVRQKLGYDPRHESEGVKKDAQDAAPPGKAIGEAHEPCACEPLVREGSGGESGGQKKSGEFHDDNGNKYCLKDGVHVKCPDEGETNDGPNLAQSTPTGGGSGTSANTNAANSNATDTGAPGAGAPGDKGNTTDTFDAEEVGKQLVAQKLLPGEKELDSIRATGVPRGVEHENAIEKRWEKALALILGSDTWKVSGKSNTVDDVSGTLTIDGVKCHVILDGKFTAAPGAVYNQEADSVQNKLRASAEHENAVVGYVVAYHVPNKGNDSKATDGVYLRIGATPQAITLSDGVVDNAKRPFGPFKILTAEQYAKLRTGDPEAVRALRDGLLTKLRNINLQNYKEQQKADALTQTGKIAGNMNAMAVASAKHGVSAEKLGAGMAGASEGLPDEVKAAQVGVLTGGLSDEHKAAVATQTATRLSAEARKRLRAQLDALDAADNDAPQPDPATTG